MHQRIEQTSLPRSWIGQLTVAADSAFVKDMVRVGYVMISCRWREATEWDGRAGRVKPRKTVFVEGSGFSKIGCHSPNLLDEVV